MNRKNDQINGMNKKYDKRINTYDDNVIINNNNMINSQNSSSSISYNQYHHNYHPSNNSNNTNHFSNITISRSNTKSN